MQSNIYPNMTDNPYDGFPFEYTKQGQQELQEKRTRGEILFPNQEQTVGISSVQENTYNGQVNSQSTPKNGNMLSNLMPLLTTMNNPNANMNDMLKLVAPYINQSGLPVTDLIKLMSQMSQNQAKKQDQSSPKTFSSTTCNIDGYDKV